MPLNRFDVVLLALGLIGVGAFSGCAARYQDRDGRVHTIGLVWHTSVLASVDPAPETSREETHQPTVSLELGPTEDKDVRLQRTRGLGVLIDVTPWQRGLGIGWMDTLLVVPDKNGITLVDYDSADWSRTSIKTAREDPASR